MAKSYVVQENEGCYVISPDHGFAYQERLGDEIALIGQVCIPPGKGGVRYETKYGLLPDGKKESVRVVGDIEVHKDHLDDVIAELQNFGWLRK